MLQLLFYTAANRLLTAFTIFAFKRTYHECPAGVKTVCISSSWAVCELVLLGALSRLRLLWRISFSFLICCQGHTEKCFNRYWVRQLFEKASVLLAVTVILFHSSTSLHLLPPFIFLSTLSYQLLHRFCPISTDAACVLSLPPLCGCWLRNRPNLINPVWWCFDVGQRRRFLLQSLTVYAERTC